MRSLTLYCPIFLTFLVLVILDLIIILLLMKFKYLAERRDSSYIHYTGLCVFIKNSLQYLHRKDLGSSEADSLWIELQLSLRSVFIGFIYRNPKDIIWEDQFCDILDNIVSQSILLLGDFNIDLLFPKHRCNAIVSSFHLQQHIKYPTGVTDDTRTLLDNIYADVNCSFREFCVVQCAISYYFPILCYVRLVFFFKETSCPRIHHEICFRNFNRFHLNAFIADNDFNLSKNRHGISDPDSALHLWVQIFLLSLISMPHIVLNE